MIIPISFSKVNEHPKTLTCEIDKTIRKVKNCINFDTISILFTIGISLANINFAIISASCYLGYKILTLFNKMCKKTIVHNSNAFLEGYKNDKYPVRQRALIDAFNQTKDACTYGFKFLGKDIFLDKNLQKKCIDETYVFTPKDIKGVRNIKKALVNFKWVNNLYSPC